MSYSSFDLRLNFLFRPSFNLSFNYKCYTRYQPSNYSCLEDLGEVVVIVVIVTGGKTKSTPSLLDLPRTGV